jgi:hypothetical protein
VKVLADVGDQLAIGGMIGRLDADDVRFEGGIVLRDVAQEPELGDRRTEQQNAVGSGQRARDRVEEPVLVVRMIVGARLFTLGMTVDVMVRRVNRRLVEGCGADVKDLRLVVVDSDCHLTHEEPPF